jgi:hypothetical protein
VRLKNKDGKGEGWPVSIRRKVRMVKKGKVAVRP